jgi:hypothetical protein
VSPTCFQLRGAECCLGSFQLCWLQVQLLLVHVVLEYRVALQHVQQLQHDAA